VSPKRETSLPLPVRFLAAWIGVWLGRSQQQLIEYQREEIQLLRQKLGGRRLPLQRWESATAGGVGEEDRTQGSWSGCHGGDAGYDPTGTAKWWRRSTMAAPNAGRGDRAPLPAVVRLLVRMAMEDPSWGYTRLRGALKNIGHELGRSTIKRVLQGQRTDKRGSVASAPLLTPTSQPSRARLGCAHPAAQELIVEQSSG